MKAIAIPIALVTLLAACSLIEDPTAAVDEAAENTIGGDADVDDAAETTIAGGDADVDEYPETTIDGGDADVDEYPETTIDGGDAEGDEAAATDFAVISVADVGVAITDGQLQEWADETGIGADSQAAYGAYVNNNDLPFVDLVNGRLLSVESSNGETSQSGDYHYVIQIAAGTTVDEILAPVAAALADAHPEWSTEEYSATEDGVAFSGVEYTTKDGTTLEVTAYTDEESPEEGQVQFESLATAEVPVEIQPALVERYQPMIEQLDFADTTPNRSYVSKGVGTTGTVSDISYVDFAIEGEDQAEWDRLAGLLGDWEQDENIINEEFPIFESENFRVEVEPALISDEPSTVSIGYFAS